MITNSPLDPRKQPFQARARATYDAILQSATQLLSADGMDHFNTNAIADRAGTSIGTLYQYFSNKESVLLALIRLQKNQMLDDIEAAMQNAANRELHDAVRLMISGRTKYLRENAQASWILSRQEILLPIQEVKAVYLMRGSQVFMRGLKYWGEPVRGMDQVKISRTIPAMVRGVMEGWIQESPDCLDTAEREAIDSVIGYLDRQRRQ